MNTSSRCTISNALFVNWSSLFQMRTGLAVILFLFITLVSQAHEYYFAFAEIEYNVSTNRFEGTIVFTTHDLEKAIQKDFPDFPVMDTMNLESKEFLLVKERILNGFNIVVDGQKLHLDLIGIENFLTGTSNAYFESEPITSPNEATFTFNLLMDEYEGQQNKISFKMNGRKETLYFINYESKQTLNLNTKTE